MKASLLTAVFLMISVGLFSQSSRRNDGERRGHDRVDNNNNRNQYNNRNDSRGGNTVYRSEDHRGSFNQVGVERNEHRPVMNYDVRRNVVRDMNYNRGYDNHNWDRGHQDDHHDYGSWRRPMLDIHRHYQAEPLEIRRARFPLFAPVRAEIIWTNAMCHDFRIYYPEVLSWRYPIGYRIACVSAYDSRNYIGEVANIYGRVIETYYNEDSDEYFLYLGDRFPYQDFSVVIPGYEARRFDRDPEYYFANSNISVTGYIANVEGRPEIQVRRASQISVY